MTRLGTSVWLVVVAFVAAACGGVQGPDGTDRSAASQKVSLTGPTASRQATTAVPQIVNPAEELLEFAPNGILRWSAVAGADAYEVWAFRDAGQTQLAEFSGALVSRQYQFRQLTGGQPYYIKLYFRANGAWGEAPMFSLKTTSSVTKPRLINSQEELDAITATGTLRWTPIAGADLYELWVYRDPGLVAFSETSGQLRIPQYQLRTLDAGKTYYARVFARINGVFHAGGALPIQVIGTSDRARIVNPQEELDAFAVNGLLRWAAVTGATAYEAWIFTNPNSSEIYESSGSLTTRVYATRTLKPSSTYYAQVYALVNGQWQVGSPVRITTTPQPTIARLTNAQEELEAFATTGTLRWGEVPGADAYEVWVYGNAGLGTVAESGSVADRAYTVKRLCSSATYYVQAYARVNGQWTVGWATRLDVTQGTSPADCVPPAPDVRLSASATDVASGQAVTLTWSSRFASGCTASDAWVGAKGTSGTEISGPLTARSLFTLVCTGTGGATLAQVLVLTENQNPVASFAVTAQSRFIPMVAQFDASASRDPDGSIVRYEWDFGDGSTAAGLAVQHTFTSVDDFEVRLTVTDDRGGQDATTRTIWGLSNVAAKRYEARAIPSLGGWYIEPAAINNHGQVAGFSYFDGTSVAHAFVHSDGVTRDLGTLGGRESYARDINDAGEIVGTSETGAAFDRGFVYREGRMQELGTLGGFISEAEGIDSQGRIVGMSSDIDGFYRCFLLEGGRMQSIGDLGAGYCIATAINDRGEIAGSAAIAGGAVHAFVYSAGAMTDIGTLGGSAASVYGMNNYGDVVGASTRVSAGYTGFLYRNGVMRQLVPTYTDPNDINDGGLIVGMAHFGDQGHAFVWDEVNGLQDLNGLIDPALGWTLQVAFGINNRGQIVATGSRAGGAHVAVLLTPAATTAQ